MATKTKTTKTAKKAPAKKTAAKKAPANMPKLAKRRAKAEAAKASAPKQGSKTEMLSAMLTKGATVEQLTEALGWLPHTLRAALSRHPAKSKIERTRIDGVTSYRLEA
jgi:hypothetical protein